MFQRLALFALATILSACAQKNVIFATLPPNADPAKGGTAREITKAKRLKPGRLVVIQGPTSATEALVNVMAPRLKNYAYSVTDPAGREVSVERYETIQYAPVFWKVDKLHIKGLKTGSSYRLTITDEYKGSKTVVDERSFQALDLSRDRVRFAALSCMADDWRFEDVIDPIWARLQDENPDLVVLNGDVVYVDSFDFVERKKANELDLWQRYIDSFKRIPYYHEARLIPTLATWDDHDFGTNDGDRDFQAKDSARRIFRAFFGGREIPGVFEYGPGGTYAVFTGFGQRLYLMDNRSYRQPNKDQKTKEVYGHWGETQYKWLMASLIAQPVPSWIFNGNQVFNGKELGFKEAMESNHPANFKRLMEDLRKTKPPIAFATGDIHFSEVMRIPAARGPGFETFEITSSSMHSYTGDGWDNPLRMAGAKTTEFNFVVVSSEAKDDTLKVNARAIGLMPGDLFRVNFEVKR